MIHFEKNRFMFSNFRIILKWEDKRYIAANEHRKLEETLEPHEDKIEYFGQEYSLVGFKVHLKRNASPFFSNTYLPTGLLTIMSFIGFVIPVDMVPGRMALLVTIFLMLVNISSTERNRGPIVRNNIIITHLFTCIIT